MFGLITHLVLAFSCILALFPVKETEREQKEKKQERQRKRKDKERIGKGGGGKGKRRRRTREKERETKRKEGKAKKRKIVRLVSPFGLLPVGLVVGASVGGYNVDARRNLLAACGEPVLVIFLAGFFWGGGLWELCTIDCASVGSWAAVLKISRIVRCVVLGSASKDYKTDDARRSKRQTIDIPCMGAGELCNRGGLY